MQFQCYYCTHSTDNYREVIWHLIGVHAADEIKFKRVRENGVKICAYKITPELCREQGRTINIDEQNTTIHVSRRGVIPKDSPMKKVVRQDSSINIDSFESLDSENVEESVDEDSDYAELVSILPDVIQALKECGKLEEYLSFNRLISEGKFPLNNIAFLLFLDIVRWYSLDNTTTLMRYSEKCKLFWRTGYKLFHGRFLRYMGGPKNSGQMLESGSSSGNFQAKDSSVNFVVPNIKRLQEDTKMISSKSPGVITEMIDDVHRNDPEQLLTYKICVDGKKINPCSKGEIDLWGFEDHPTLEEKRYRLKSEMTTFSAYIRQTERQLEIGYTNLSEVTCNIGEFCKQSIQILSNRIKDLRLLKVKKEIALRKLHDQIEGDWRASKFSIVISSIRTSVYQIDNCIEDMLSTNEKLCQFAAVAYSSKEISFKAEEKVELQKQANYVCLGFASSQNSDTPLIKQRSEAWHDLRKSCLVTGSTINKSIGLDGLKQQKLHIDTKSGRKEPEPVSEDLQRKFDYGSKNELNAVGTIVSSFLPAFETGSLFYEEGCYVIEENGEPCLVISPDGSIRKNSSVIAGVEIKCPIPGKLYTTQIQYSLPHYYVPQVLSEMSCLGVEQLYFVSYGQESTAVHLVNFDSSLWNDICAEVNSLDPEHPPKKLSMNIPKLKEDIKQFCTSKVKLIAEVKSKTAIPCVHPDEVSGRVYHTSEKNSDETILLSEVQKALIRGKDAIEASDELCAKKASEVLVFVLSDLDRIHKPEIPSSFPIAYAFKGYSMKAEVMRRMIEIVLYELYVRGLYTPVVSYDGQWAVLANRAKDGTPLTLLELQKYVFNQVKARKKSEITKFIFETAVVKSNDSGDLEDKINYCYDEERKAIHLSLKNDVKMFQPSIHIKTVQGKDKKTNRKKKNSIEAPVENADTEILSMVSSEALDALEDEEMELLYEVERTSHLSPINRSNGSNQPTINIAETVISEWNESDESSQQCSGVDISEQLEQMEIDDKTEEYQRKVIDKDEIAEMLNILRVDEKSDAKWRNTTTDDFESILKDSNKAKSVMTKNEMIKCLISVEGSLSKANLRFCKSWNKSKLSEFIRTVLCECPVNQSNPTKKKRRCNPQKLVVLCKRVINQIPKTVLNAVVAEYEMVDEVNSWRENSPFTPVTDLGIEKVTWFSVPEYNSGTLSYIFSYLDVHHLITNCRIKVCRDGLSERGISKQAWIDVAKSNTTKLKVPHVEDLVDKQSGALARETFSEEVQSAMSSHYPKEAYFCKLVREFYEAEDDPGISANERYRRRMEFRSWLLEGVNFCQFPPYGSHVRSIPTVMFQGFLTNIERRIQLFPYVKSGRYNVRALGSLEAENLFGQFQDLDPKGSGVMKSEDIPTALEHACQLLKVRLLPDRPFHMTLTRAKVYPVNELLDETGADDKGHEHYIYPNLVNRIYMRDHVFDVKSRGKRKARRRLVEIKGPNEAARGVSGVRQFHKCDESKILPHKRLGIEMDL